MRMIVLSCCTAQLATAQPSTATIQRNPCDSLVAHARACREPGATYVDAWVDLLRAGCIADSDSALRQARRAREIAFALTDRTHQVAASRTLAELLFVHGKKADGIAELVSCLPLLDQRRDPDVFEAVHLRLADHLDETFELERSMEHYEAALRSKEARGDLRGVAGVLNNIGIIQIKQGDVKGALLHHRRCLQIHTSLGDSSRIAATRNRIGVALREADQHSEALEQHLESLHIYQRLGHAMGTAAALNNLAATYNALGRYDEAADHAARSLAIREREGETYAVGYALIQLGRARLRQGKPEDAVKHAERARHIALRIHLFSLEQDACALLHEAYRATGDADRALENLERYILLRDSFRTEENQRAVLRQEYEHRAHQVILADSLRQEQERAIERTASMAQRRQIITIAISAFALLGGTAWFFYDRRKRAAHFEREQAVLKERLRIADDLHDDLGAGLSTLRLRGEMALRRVEDPAQRETLASFSTLANDLSQNMREILWAISSERTTLKDLIDHLGSRSREFLFGSGIEMHMHTSEVPEREVTAQVRRNLPMALKEALNNVLKHAHASNVWINITWLDGLELILRDDGIGMDVRTHAGNGLRTIRQRIANIGGTASCGKHQNGGTVWRFHVPIPAGNERSIGMR